MTTKKIPPPRPFREIRIWLEGPERFKKSHGNDEPFRAYGISWVWLDEKNKPAILEGKIRAVWKSSRGRILFENEFTIGKAEYVTRKFADAPVIQDFVFGVVHSPEPAIALRNLPYCVELTFTSTKGIDYCRKEKPTYKQVDPTLEENAQGYPFRGLGLPLVQTIGMTEEELAKALGNPQRKFALEVPHPDSYGIQRFRRFAPRPKAIAPGSVCEAWCYDNPEENDWVLFLTPDKQPTLSLRMRLANRPRGSIAKRLMSFFMAREIPEEERQPMRVPGTWKIEEALTGEKAWISDVGRKATSEFGEK